ncbi:putative LPS assembly protein LptD [Paradesertivirga mongoliensis]|uniref:LPS assembly protein LptD n=1 Tax=Paradesertivirga mongoliensis TaxID=2100740 RepID=A0ABW4ZQX6_9SPHI|nr:putative LPS assembly protein LptD [Pedobacter mongoliensis]
MKFIKKFFVRTLFLILLLFSNFDIFSQSTPPKTDTSQLITPITDTLSKNSTSSSGLSSEVKYTADDSIKFSIDGNIVYLYGNARVSHEEMELSSSYIRLDQKNKLLFASGQRNKYSVYKGRPILKQGSEPPVTSDSLVFNFDTKRGKSFGTLTEVDGGFIQANQFKKNEYNEGFFKNGIYSTCSLPEPHTHFGIHITRGIVTEKQVISGPAYLVIEHVPLPAAIPFGFFPKTNKRASGLLFPTFGEDGTRGFFMRGLGWYFGINDYWDAEVRGTLYSKLSYETSLQARYRKNYKYSGGLNLSYASNRDPNSIEGTVNAKPRKDFNIQWTHSQSAEANPGTSFSANVNIGTSSYFQNTRVAGDRIEQATNSSVSSGINYQRTFANNLFNFSTSLRHSQDLQKQRLSLDLPTFNLGMTTINPFESKSGSANPKWYERISVGYSMQGSNSISDAHEDSVFKKETLKRFRNGIQHSVPISMSFNVAKYFQFSSGVSYGERWTLQTIRKRYDTDLKKVLVDTVSGFARNYDYSLNTGFSTKLYGTKNFRKGNLVAIRHVMTPNFSFSYRPDFSSDRFGFWRNIDVPADADTVLRDTRYSIYERAIGGGPGSGRSANINFSFENNIEAKVKSKSDTSSKFEKKPIIQGLTFSGNYDFEAEELNRLSTISFGGRTAFFKQKLAISFQGVLDPYRLDTDGSRRIGFLFQEGRLARLSSFSFSTGFNLNPAAFKRRQDNLTEQQNNPNTTQQQREDISEILRNPNGFVDFSIPWNLNASYSFFFSNNGVIRNVTNNLNFTGDFSVTPKWKVSYSSGWDFKANDFTTTSFAINRDLHCWDLAFNWVPFGLYKSYSVDLRVRASILQDLKLSRRSASNSGIYYR